MFLLQVIGFYSHPIYSMISLSETENVPCPKFKNKVGGQLPPPPSKSAQYNFRIWQDLYSEGMSAGKA